MLWEDHMAATDAAIQYAADRAEIEDLQARQDPALDQWCELAPDRLNLR